MAGRTLRLRSGLPARSPGAPPRLRRRPGNTFARQTERWGKRGILLRAREGTAPADIPALRLLHGRLGRRGDLPASVRAWSRTLLRRHGSAGTRDRQHPLSLVGGALRGSPGSQPATRARSRLRRARDGGPLFGGLRAPRRSPLVRGRLRGTPERDPAPDDATRPEVGVRAREHAVERGLRRRYRSRG